SEQKALFKILGRPDEAIGVKLTDSYLMLPIKSLCGIKFYCSESFINCVFCERENCQNRRTGYDHKAYQRRYMMPKHGRML
ncbi:MAG: hypothetical protein GX974_01975, partial [Clostridiales bacterium]|nr:hypothetical protein [Clostridiales bacterium]